MTLITRITHKLDADGKTLGRFATEIANLLRGKNKVGFTLHQDHGDIVIVSNSNKIRVTGNKLADKMYYRHSFYPGSLKEMNLEKMLDKKPNQVIFLAVKNMLPDNRLRSRWLTRLKFEEQINE